MRSAARAARRSSRSVRSRPGRDASRHALPGPARQPGGLHYPPPGVHDRANGAEQRDPGRSRADQAIRLADRAAERQLRAAPGRARRRSSARTAPARRRCCRSSPASSTPTRVRSRRLGTGDRLGARSSRRCTRSSRSPRTSACSRAWRRSPTPRRRSSRCSTRPISSDRADEEVGRSRGGNQQRVNIAIGLLCEPPALLLDEPSRVARPAPARAPVGVHRRPRRTAGTTVVFSTHNVAEVERYADRMLVLVDGELLFTGTPAELAADRRRRHAGLRGRVRALPARARATEQRGAPCAGCSSRTSRSCAARRCSSALLVVYPIAIALMIGFALSSPPGKPKVAFYNEVPPGKGKINLGSQQINISSYATQLFQSIQPIKVHSRDEAIAKVKSGEALAAVIIPGDIAVRDPEPRHQRRRQPDRSSCSSTRRTRSSASSSTRRSARA